MNRLPWGKIWLRWRCLNGFNCHRTWSPRNTLWESQSIPLTTPARDRAFNFISRRLVDSVAVGTIRQYQRFVIASYFSFSFIYYQVRCRLTLKFQNSRNTTTLNGFFVSFSAGYFAQLTACQVIYLVKRYCRVIISLSEISIVFIFRNPTERRCGQTKPAITWTLKKILREHCQLWTPTNDEIFDWMLILQRPMIQDLQVF